MIIHFIAGKSNINEDIDYFQRITSLIKSAGHTIAREWLKEVQQSSEEVQWSKLYRKNVEAVDKADVIIAEATTRSFGVGFQVALAIRSKKPTLLMIREDVDRKSIMWGIDEELVRTRVYDDTTLDTTVLEFLRDFNTTTKEKRFNLVLERRLQNYLTWASKRSGKTRAQLIRELIMSDMHKQDFLD